LQFLLAAIRVAGKSGGAAPLPVVDENAGLPLIEFTMHGPLPGLAQAKAP